MEEKRGREQYITIYFAAYSLMAVYVKRIVLPLLDLSEIITSYYNYLILKIFRLQHKQEKCLPSTSTSTCGPAFREPSGKRFRVT